jgi:two-component SAPR family response regulator
MKRLSLLLVLLTGCGWFSEAKQVAQEEVGPRALLKKYETFKDMAAALDARAASIKVYENKMADLKKEYAGEPRSKWSREDREQWNQWTAELAGIKASYNDLAASYNSAMSKNNWAFTNVGDLPKGADKPLPREFRTYQEN